MWLSDSIYPLLSKFSYPHFAAIPPIREPPKRKGKGRPEIKETDGPKKGTSEGRGNIQTPTLAPILSDDAEGARSLPEGHRYSTLTHLYLVVLPVLLSNTSSS